MANKRLVNAALDCISHFLTSRMPLKKVASTLIASRNLNSRERKVLLDLVFRWSREIFLVDQFTSEKIPFGSGRSRQDKNRLAFELFLADNDEVSTADPQAMPLANEYHAWKKGLGNEMFLNSLGPLIKKHLLRDYGENAFAIAQGLLARPAKYFAIDRRSVNVLEVLNALSALNIKTFQHQILPTAIGTRDDFFIDDVPKGIVNHVWLMDAGSQIIAELVQPEPSDRVLDLCAGEGNKARYITMKECHYVAADIDETRLNKAKARLLHKKNVTFVLTDGRKTPFLKNEFDWILLDAPCSGTGTLRRHPDLVHRLTSENLTTAIKLQSALLAHAVTLLKPGGRLIYATCSLLQAENEQQIHHITRKDSSLISLPLRELKNNNLKFSHEEVNKNSLTLFPHIHDCDGFFLSVITKKARE